MVQGCIGFGGVARKRAWTLGQREDGRLCPRPRKRVYTTLEEAEAHIAADFPTDDRIHPYRCVCGLIHIGHQRRPAEVVEREQVGAEGGARVAS
jgi:hypothetical protein